MFVKDAKKSEGGWSQPTTIVGRQLVATRRAGLAFERIDILGTEALRGSFFLSSFAGMKLLN